MPRSEGFILPETLVLAGAICAGGAIIAGGAILYQGFCMDDPPTPPMGRDSSVDLCAITFARDSQRCGHVHVT